MVDFSTCTLLVVDDNEASLDTLIEVLGSDFVVSVATDGPSALSIVAEDPPDLILLDILMPDMDGYEVCRRLKASPSGRNIPVLFLTALTDLESKTLGFEVGGVDYVTKPFEPAEVRSRVRTHLELSLARRTLAEQNEQLLEAQRLREEMERISRHDMRSPLTIIIGGPEMIRDDENLSDEQRIVLSRIEQAGRRILGMVNTSLDLYKMETRSYELRGEPVDLLPVLKTVVDDLSALMEAKGLAMEILLDDARPRQGDAYTVWGEGALCYCLLANLLMNALEASPQGEAVTVFLEKGPSACIAITNRGEVPESVRDRFFDKYVSSGKEGGTGIGTYSARLLARTQGGDVTVDTSTPGHTTVNLRLARPTA